MGKPAEGVLRGDGGQGGGDGGKQIGMVAGLGFAKKSLELAPHHFDGIEIRGVRWKETHLGFGLCDQFKCTFVFMGAEVVHDDDVSGLKGGNEYLADIGVEDLGVGRALDGHASGGAVQPH